MKNNYLKYQRILYKGHIQPINNNLEKMFMEMMKKIMNDDKYTLNSYNKVR